MKDITVKIDITIRQAMKALDKTAEKCLLVTDDNNKLLGTIADGDLRRGILKGMKFSDSILECYHKSPTTLMNGDFSQEDVSRVLRDKKLNLIPVIDKDGKVVDYLTWSNIKGGKRPVKKLDNVSVVIMAGGKGTRMQPFTKILPKPLVPVHEKPIIEHIIERFTDVGCDEFHLTVNYKGRILKAYFEELQPDYGIHYVDEQEPLGTAGSLRFLKGKFNQPFFVTNCDIIIKADYTSLYEFHQKGGYDVTLVASTKEYIIPYGTCELNGDGHLSHINEKPHYDFLINTGLYVLNPDVLKLIPKNTFFHITHLIEDAKSQGKKIGVFPVDDDAWIDVGEWAEYQKAVERF
ncbi:MAG: NTP transferase domain-containing protein [Candidatus Marinimicrobia bacterium]|jgi:dTDP-glucose pyrophosphorylase|nr:NTP transferase domain-containing protein [Candidatus Neomarinimicrobiota bacterium]